MIALNSLAIEHGNRLQSAAYGLETLGNLLGADASEHLLSDADLNGLAHAVCTLAGYIQAAGMALFEAAEMEAEQ